MDQGGCALRVLVENNEIKAIRGDKNGYLNKGFVCYKGLHSMDRLNHPKRLRSPLKRTGQRGDGRWAAISWDEALDAISNNLLQAKENHGARSVAFIQGMPKGLDHFILIRLANIFGSPNVIGVQDVCHAPRELTGRLTCGFYPVCDLHYESDLVLVWGANPEATNEEGLTGRLLFDQVKKGTRLVTVDPRKTTAAAKASLWLPVKPGTDFALALSFLQTIISEKRYDADFVEAYTTGFEKLEAFLTPFLPENIAGFTGLGPDVIRSAARMYAEAKPAAILWGNALEQTSNNYETLKALIWLMAICGNLDIQGGNIQAVEPEALGPAKLVRADLIPDKRNTMLNAFHGTAPGFMTIPSSFFREAVLNEKPYPVKAAYVQCANPITTFSDAGATFEAFKKLDFVAVSDIFMTPTARMADIVLPAATHFEFNDIGHYGIGHGLLLARPKIVEPPSDCRPDMRILNDLGKRMTDPLLWFESENDIPESVVKPLGMSYENFCREGWVKGRDVFRKYEKSGFKTKTGKISLDPVDGFADFNRLKNELEKGVDNRYPLVLTSAKSPYYTHSAYRWIEGLRRKDPLPVVKIHPETAALKGILDGDPVMIESRKGAMTQYAELDMDIPKNVIVASYGWWFPENAGGGEPDLSLTPEAETVNFNRLTSGDIRGKAFGTPDLRGISVTIRKGNHKS